MTKRKTKHALLMSGLALLLCVSMLIGSTYAWFTDSVTSTGNKIQSGTLKLDLEVLGENGWVSIKEDKTALFNYDKWEPGYVDVQLLKVENEGSLALKWVAKFVSEQELSVLADVIDVYVLPYGVLADDSTVAFPAGRDLTGYTKVGTVKEFVNTIRETTHGTLLAGEAAYLGFALKMREDAGNTYQDKTLGAFDIRILATQLTYEKDSFDDQYDVDSTFPNGKNSKTSKVYTKAADGIDFAVSIDIPAEAPEGEYEIDPPLPEDIVFTNSNGVGTMSFDLSLMRTLNGVTESAGNTGARFPVTVSVPHPFLEVTKVYHNGVEIEDFTYDSATGLVSFTTTHFSPFSLEYKDYTDSSYELKYTKTDEGVSITKGMFVDVDPKTFDSSLESPDSKYMVVDFVKGGKTYYVVSEKATSYFIEPTDSGKLWSIISGLQNNAHSTVYIKPGEYSEATTINVYSSMDIIGLGDAEDIKIVKVSSSSSNRHLFNCNGTKADYIEVTLRNLSLDATAKTTNSKDNAVVQSIRKTKVKCFDLTIVKGSDWDAVAFYVNGNNAVDGVKYPAYLYAENCSLDTTRTYGIVSTKGSYKFYHSGLTYSGTAYTKNSGSIKNVRMAADDWDW